ncbi:MAG: prolyl oligopeptidase family serine peptidase [Clostridia bacterium]|nr:prolyl oligopeptidase family serine peptidase [Clostridia bacterium]
MKKYRPAKKGFAIWMARLLFALVLIGAAILHAYGMLETALDGRRARSAGEKEPSYFQLREQMFAGQADTRVSGWLSLAASEEIEIKAERGKLAATHYFPVKRLEDAPWALVLHGGLGTDRSQVLDIACMLSLSGYHVLTPDLYAHGQSEGSISSLGICEAQDVESWVGWILAQDADAEIVLYGQDEGGVACLLAGKALSHTVRAVAVDSAYDSVGGRMMQLAEEARGRLSGAEGALLSAAFRLAHGVTTEAGEIEERVRDYPLPLLLIHGTGDEDVPAWHSEDIALAAGEKAELYFAEGAGHGMARYLEAQEYSEVLLGFFAEAVGSEYE